MTDPTSLPETGDIPRVSVIIPCRNEAAHIEACLRSVLENNYPADALEILVVDGMSDDDTRRRVAAIAAQHRSIRLVDNPGRIVPTAMNLGIAAATGDIILRMDAHAKYPPNYIAGLVGWLERTGADNVGGAWVTRPGADTAMARAIAAALSHPFGIGNAQFRLGTSEPREVDTVPFGCYRRAVFERIGLFDEMLVRNQDDELNLRLIRAGGRIMLVPDIVSDYYARAHLRQVARMYYQYGYFKPLVLAKVGRVMTLRPLAPPLFVLALALSALATPWWQLAAWGLGALAAAYGAVAAAVVAGRGPRLGLRAGVCLGIVFPVVHAAYGTGFLHGAWHFLALGRTSVPAARVKLSR